MEFLQLCLRLDSYSDLFRAFELDPEQSFKHGADILRIEKHILKSLSYRLFQVTPSDLVFEILTIFKQSCQVSSKELEELLIESLFNSQLL